MKKHSAKILCFALALIMAFTLIPLKASASSVAPSGFAMMRQTDSQWNYYYHNGGSLTQTGCGIFSLANTVGYLTGYTMDVVEIANWAHNNGMYNVDGADGTYRTSFYPRANSRYGSTYGFSIDCSSDGSGYWSDSYDSRIKNHIINGGVAVAHVYNHFIAVVGYDSATDSFHIWDCAPRDRRGTLYANGNIWFSRAHLNSATYMTIDWFCLVSSTKPLVITDNPDDHNIPTRDLYSESTYSLMGDDVVWVQAVLYQLGYSIDIDGSFGPATEKVVMQFQTDNGLEVDGICGPNTRAKLKELWEKKKNTLTTIVLTDNSGYALKDKAISKVKAQTTVSSVLGNLKNTDATIYSAAGAELGSSDICGTGCFVKIAASSTEKVSIIVKGDVDGNGSIDGTDYVRVKSCFLETFSLDGVYSSAADVDESGKVDSTDYIRLKGHFLGNYNVYA